MIRNLLASWRRQNATRELRWLRAYAGDGDRVAVIMTDGGHGYGTGVITNTRNYSTGLREVYVIGDNFKFAGWYSVERIYPEDSSAFIFSEDLKQS